ncbi:hypothetical protein TRIATDRAFT_84950 [Trichoderma atroviride IMI 206040]|uniref:Uncharacterized protein n=1 Tax=Hypocrea atroviridis (strain ATCC 20476 / IMI 206040) TaxID=452589 RepID=G9P4T1_HYPAI|nr:uncharacterized protein TRIATDRAFT_84950 [Trichoderma atroviride IMI 206040]EHK41225.1 hypothetical protein TRIATDRAFT_84950 [Trichoderma atroviride IMI 206040]
MYLLLFVSISSLGSGSYSGSRAEYSQPRRPSLTLALTLALTPQQARQKTHRPSSCYLYLVPFHASIAPRSNVEKCSAPGRPVPALCLATRASEPSRFCSLLPSICITHLQPGELVQVKARSLRWDAGKDASMCEASLANPLWRCPRDMHQHAVEMKKVAGLEIARPLFCSAATSASTSLNLAHVGVVLLAPPAFPNDKPVTGHARRQTRKKRKKATPQAET